MLVRKTRYAEVDSHDMSNGRSRDDALEVRVLHPLKLGSSSEVVWDFDFSDSESAQAPHDLAAVA